MTEHHRLLCQDRLRCACGWSVPWPAADRWGEIWDAHIQAVESAQPQGAPAGAVTSGSPVVPQPAPVAYRHACTTFRDPFSGAQLACSCGWRGGCSPWSEARRHWLEHAVAAYRQEEAIATDDDEADCDALAGDDVAGSEVRE